MRYLAPLSYLLLFASTLLPGTLANAIPREAEGLVERQLPLTEEDNAALLKLNKLDFHCANQDQKRSLDGLWDLEKRADPFDELRTGLATCVAMTSQQYKKFSPNGFGIGTIGLCGCTAVVVASKVGAIVSHVAPSQASVNGQLTAIKDLFTQNAADLAGAAVYIFPPAVNGVIDVRAFQNVIRDYLIDNVGRNIMMKAYERTALTDQNSNNGVVLVNLVNNALSIYLDGVTIPTT